MKNIKDRLKKSGLRVTPIREEVLEYFTDQQRALAHADIEANYKNKFDRVTLYRTLTTFIESGILHKVSDN
ncbi:MAG TPA: transcriptional repressor, partial [Chitinophagales bacterium]|nr:transcriptional repressor [Chitinophagales bacterium]